MLDNSHFLCISSAQNAGFTAALFQLTKPVLRLYQVTKREDYASTDRTIYGGQNKVDFLRKRYAMKTRLHDISGWP